MLLIIHNFAYHTRLSEIRKLLFDKCGLTDVVLDNFTNEGNTKRITVGLADDFDAALVVRNINGLSLDGMQLYVEDVRQKRLEQQSYPRGDPVSSKNPERSQYELTQTSAAVYQQPQYQQAALPVPQEMPPTINPYQMAYSNMPFYMTPMQNPYNYETGAACTPNMQYPDYGQQNITPENQWQSQPSEMYQYQARQEPKQAPKSAIPQNNEESHFASASTSRKSWDNKDIHRVGREGPKKRSRSNERGHDYDDERGYNERYSPKRSNWNDSEDNSRSNWNRKQLDGKRDNNSYKDANIGYKSRKLNEQQRPSYNKPDTSRFNRFDQPPARDRYSERKSYERSSESGNNSWRDNPKHAPENNAYNNRSETISRPYGNNAGNSTFNKTKELGHDNKFTKPNVQEKTFDRKPSKPGKNVAASNFFTNTFKNYARNYPNSNINESRKKPENVGRQIIRHKNWRFQASSILAKEILENANRRRCKLYVQQALKSCVVARLDSVLGDTIVSNLNQMIEIYRQTFSKAEDPMFFAAVLEKATRSNIEKKSAEPKVPSQPQPKTILAPPEPYKAASDVIPKYPNADKKLFNKQKQEQRFLELQDDYGYELEAPLRNALDEELQELCDVYTNACFNSKDFGMQKIRTAILNEPLAKFRKIMDLHVTKRLLNICNTLDIRIFFNPKAPPAEQLRSFLKNYNISSLKKSEKNKMFVATCSNFKGYDELLALRSIVLGTNTLQFKPLHITGVPEKKLKAKEVKFRARLQNEKDVQEVIQKCTGAQDDVNQGGEVVHLCDEDSDVIEIPFTGSDIDNIIVINDSETTIGDKEQEVQGAEDGKTNPDSETTTGGDKDNAEDGKTNPDSETTTGGDKDNAEDGKTNPDSETTAGADKVNAEEGKTNPDSENTTRAEPVADNSDWDLNGADPEVDWDFVNREEELCDNNKMGDPAVAPTDSVDFTEDDLEDF